MMRLMLLPLILSSPFLSSSPVAAATDPDGNVIVPYTNSNGDQATHLYITANKVVPTVVTSLRSGSSVGYAYTISSGPSSRQPIESFRFKSPASWTSRAASTGVVFAPAGFVGGGGEDPSGGFFYAWVSDEPASGPRTFIQPGRSQSGFGLQAPYLAGILQGKIFGYVPNAESAATTRNVDANGTEVETRDLDEQLLDLMENDGVSVLIAGPAIATETSPAATAIGLKREVVKWPDLQQASASFVAQVGQNLDVFIRALEADNSTSAMAAEADIEAFVNASSRADLSALGAYILKFDLRELSHRAVGIPAPPPEERPQSPPPEEQSSRGRRSVK